MATCAAGNCSLHIPVRNIARFIEIYSGVRPSTHDHVEVADDGYNLDRITFSDFASKPAFKEGRPTYTLD